MSTRQKKTITRIVIFTAIVISVWCFLFKEGPLLNAKLSLPLEAKLGSSTTMTITATNDHTKPIILGCIDISDSFIAGFQVILIDPQPVDTFHISLFNMRSWEFAKIVPPGESIIANFELKPVSEGRFMGEIDICNTNENYKALYADIIVKEDFTMK